MHHKESSAWCQKARTRERRRWEYELYDRELKRPLRKSAVLPSHTVETGAQAIAAVARARTPAAAGTAGLDVLRV